MERVRWRQVGRGSHQEGADIQAGQQLSGRRRVAPPPRQDAGGISDVRSDPALMCVAIHWMEAAERGGDELARSFLGQNEIGHGLMG